MRRHPESFRRRFICMLTGICFMGLALSFLISISLGTDPCTSFNLAVAKRLQISFGNWQLICNLILFSIVIASGRHMIGIGTVFNMVCIGYIADSLRWLYSLWLPEDFFTRDMHPYLIMLPALALLVVSAALYMTADLGLAPYDAIPYIITARCKRVSFKYIRTIWDISFVLACLLLGGLVGIVTVISACIAGPVIAAVARRVEPFFCD